MRITINLRGVHPRRRVSSTSAGAQALTMACVCPVITGLRRGLASVAYPRPGVARVSWRPGLVLQGGGRRDHLCLESRRWGFQTRGGAASGELADLQQPSTLGAAGAWQHGGYVAAGAGPAAGSRSCAGARHGGCLAELSGERRSVTWGEGLRRRLGTPDHRPACARPGLSGAARTREARLADQLMSTQWIPNVPARRSAK